MILTVCGSVKEYFHITALKAQLETLGHRVLVPPSKIEDPQGNPLPVGLYHSIRNRALTEGRSEDQWVWGVKEELMRRHYQKVEDGDAIVVCNYHNTGRPHYIGPNTFGEMILAHYLRRPIYLQHPFDPQSPFAEEFRSLQLIVLNDDVSRIALDKTPQSP